MIKETARVLAAYLANNRVTTEEIPNVIRATYWALSSASTTAEAPVLQQPAVPIKKSVTPSAIICLECGRRQKMLKRHLSTGHDLTPVEYKAKWSLPASYPLIAPEYSAERSSLAMKIGLGRKPKAAAIAPAKAPKKVTMPVAKPKRGGSAKAPAA